MKHFLARLIFSIRTNFWFLPTMLALAAVAAALFVVELDLTIQRRSFIPLSMSVESARLALSTIAGSMITIASLVFSMTLVALTSVSQQLGPRILIRFMDDRPTQFVLGIFVATFLFSLILLIRVGDDAEMGRVPGLGVTLSAVMAIAALGGMIHFFDHVAKRIQADSLISELGGDLVKAATLHSERSGDGDKSGGDASADAEPISTAERLFDNGCVVLLAQPRSGYLRLLDASALCHCAQQHDAVLRLEARQGTFVLEGQAVLSVALPSDADALTSEARKQLTELLLVGPKRLPEASIDFEISALVEVALRALSPGINDPFTAVACIDHLADGLRILAATDDRRRVHRDDEGTIRLMQQPEPFARHLAQAFGSIIECSRDNGAVRERLAQITAQLLELVDGDEARNALKEMRTQVTG